MAEHLVHSAHGHKHSGHGHTDFLHDGHLHFQHGDHYDEHVLEVSSVNPNDCKSVKCECAHDDCGHVEIPHGDHMDHVFNGMLHHRHGDHCDNHGSVRLT